MDSAEIPDDIRRFLLQHIDSVAKLEGLLLMHRPAWDIVVWLLSILGVIVSVSGVVVGWRYLRR